MPIPDEKSRAWTRAEDYWPPRRLRRTGKNAAQRFRPHPAEERASKSRPSLEIIPYAVLMLGLAVLAIAIITLAWPGRVTTRPPAKAETIEVGTAPKGWMEQR